MSGSMCPQIPLHLMYVISYYALCVYGVDTQTRCISDVWTIIGYRLLPIAEELLIVILKRLTQQYLETRAPLPMHSQGHPARLH